MAISGKSGEVDNGATMLGVKSGTMDYTFDALEATDFADVGVRAYIPGCSGWSGSFEGYKEAAPETIGTEIALSLKESQTATQKWVGQAIITGVHPSTSYDGVVSYSYDFQGTGAIGTFPTT